MSGTVTGHLYPGSMTSTYSITPLGPWPVSMFRREPELGQMFAVDRDGSPARPVLAYTSLGEFKALEHRLQGDGLDRPRARRRTEAAFRYLGHETTRRFAETRNLRHRDGDHPLALPVELAGEEAHRLALSPGLPEWEDGQRAGELFEVLD